MLSLTKTSNGFWAFLVILSDEQWQWQPLRELREPSPSTRVYITGHSERKPNPMVSSLVQGAWKEFPGDRPGTHPPSLPIRPGQATCC